MAGSIYQSRNVFTAVGFTTQTLAFSSNNVAGNVLFVASGAYVASGSLSCTDSNNSYTPLDTIEPATVISLQDWYVANCAAGANTVTITSSPSNSYGGVYICEITGVTTAAVDKHAAQIQYNPAGTDAVSSGSVTTTATDCCIAVSYQVNANGDAPTVGTNFTLDNNFWPSTGNRATSEFRTGVAAGSTAATFTAAVPANDSFGTVGAWFTESGGTGVAWWK